MLPEFRAVWIVRSRQIINRYAYWLVILGYDPRDRSFLQRIYLIYLLIFFGIWAFAVLAFLAGMVAAILAALNLDSPKLAAVVLWSLILVVWVLSMLYKVSRRSPFVFSECDAYQICQTPVDRRTVALIWLLGEWPEAAALFWAGAITFGFGLVEIELHGDVVWRDAPQFALSGLRSLAIILPLHLALLLVTWAVGAYRLKRDNDQTNLHLVAPALASLLSIGLLIGGSGNLWARLASPSWQRLLWPITFPLQAAFGISAWSPGLVVALFLVGVGLVALWVSASTLNLSRAAQETRNLAPQQLAIRRGNLEQARNLRRESRLGLMHKPIRIPSFSGLWAVVWRNTVQSLRTFELSKLLPWLSIFGLGLAAVLAPDWGTRGWAIAIWVLLVGEKTSARFRLNLAKWWLLRQLPHPLDQLVLAEIVGPVLGVVLVTWIALGMSIILGAQSGFIMGSAIPLVALGIALAAVFDVLRACHASDLLAGMVPRVGALAFVLGLLFVLVPALVAEWVIQHTFSAWMGALGSVLISLALVFGLWRLTIKRYRRI